MKKLLIWVLAGSILSMQTGCVQQDELGNISVVTGLFLEKHQKNYILIADCANVSEQKSGEMTKTQPIRVSAPSLEEAFFSLEKHSKTPLYLFRAKVLLLGKELQENLEGKWLEELFYLRMIPADISVLRADFTENDLFLKEDKSFGIPLTQWLRKEEYFLNCKLYQIIKNQENLQNIPTVSLSENGFFPITNVKDIKK